MSNFMLTPLSNEIQELAHGLGLRTILFQERDFLFYKGDNKKELDQLITKSYKLKIPLICSPTSEVFLRHVIEKTPVHYITGIEFIHPNDSLHQVRGGLDQVLAPLLHQKQKEIIFSFAEILHSHNRAKLLARVRFNLMLCHKYNVDVCFTTFGTTKSDLRSLKDMQMFWKLLGGRNEEVGFFRLCRKSHIDKSPHQDILMGAGWRVKLHHES